MHTHVYVHKYKTVQVVALSKVMQLVKKAEFDRVIVDTAPTGHTLRLLAFPDFVDNFLQKLLSIKKKVCMYVCMCVCVT